MVVSTGNHAWIDISRQNIHLATRQRSDLNHFSDCQLTAVIREGKDVWSWDRRMNVCGAGFPPQPARSDTRVISSHAAFDYFTSLSASLPKPLCCREHHLMG